MGFRLKDSTAFDFVALKVQDLDASLEFYKNTLGLDLLREENGMAFIGIKEPRKPLLCLVDHRDGTPDKMNHNGLFYFALRLPTRQSLAEVYQHLLDLKYPMQAVSNQGHSEVIYLKDPEFNGIKLYWDKPQAEWDYHTDGSMDMILEHLDTRELLAAAQEPFSHMPAETRVGHVHLNVVDLEESQRFYERVLGLRLTSAKFPSLRYLAVGDYHQHVTINTFHQVKKNVSNDDNLGLDYIAFKIETPEEMLVLEEHLTSLDVPHYFNEGKKIIQLDDPNGIHVWFHLNDFKK